MQKRIGIILGLVVILGSIGFLLFGKLEKNIVYFVTPTELLAKGDHAFGRSVRLGGTVKKGTIDWKPSPPVLHFIVTDGTHEIPIVSEETPPQMFQDEMGVVLEGKLLAQGTFQAERLMVKHSNEYRPPQEGEKPAILYKDLVQ
ncbi:MAG: cytochrome c maturation protein CcmE [Deltaproteobacteria bacterium]|nr:cytochrome c maturation protein CcmE [Deltaproteobacteria bacterium]